MCGIVGCAGKIGVLDEKAFRMLLNIDTIRGPHSTGILFVDKFSGGCEVLKKVGTPWDLEQYSAYSTLTRKVSKVLMGHNRWATKGAVNNINAHPFEFNGLIGAHNGTLTSTYQLDDNAEFDVDSENIYYHMNLNGVDDTIPKLNGAFALSWWDKEDETLNLIRNDERPLSYTLTEDGATVYWASESWMLYAMAHKCGIKIGKVIELKSHELHTFNVPKSGDLTLAVRKLEEFVKPTPTPSNLLTYINEEVEFYIQGEETNSYGQKYLLGRPINDTEVEIRLYPQVGSSVWNEMLEGFCTYVGTPQRVVTLNGVIHLVIATKDLVKLGFDEEDDINVSEDHYNKTNKGCAWCSDEVPYSAIGTVTWLPFNEEYVCEDCAKLAEVQQHLGAA